MRERERERERESAYNRHVYLTFHCSGLLPLTSLLSHSCAPNARLAIAVDSEDGKRNQISNRVISAVDLAEGSPLTINYVHLHLSNFERRPKISDNWYFDCDCARCNDVDELGTRADAIKCDQCGKPEMLPERARDQVIKAISLTLAVTLITKKTSDLALIVRCEYGKRLSQWVATING